MVLKIYIFQQIWRERRREVFTAFSIF